MSNRDDVERRLDLAADLALRTRDRIEAAINNGEVPSWVQDACNVLERASVQYGELSEQLKPAQTDEIGHDRELPAALFTFQSLTIH
jgi:hypothetical protein